MAGGVGFCSTFRSKFARSIGVSLQQLLVSFIVSFDRFEMTDHFDRKRERLLYFPLDSGRFLVSGCDRGVSWKHEMKLHIDLVSGVAVAEVVELNMAFSG